MKPEDIPPARGVNIIVGVCLLALSSIFWLPIFGTLYYDGIGDVFDWPTLFYWLLAAAMGLTFLGLRLLLGPQRVGAEATFTDGGFSLRVRVFFRRELRVQLAWRDIEEMKLIEAPRGGDALAFRLTHDAAVKHKLVQPTTKEDAPKQLVRREITFPIKLSALGPSEAAKRFQASAAQSGATLVETASVNVVVFVRKVWSVEWP